MYITLGFLLLFLTGAGNSNSHSGFCHNKPNGYYCIPVYCSNYIWCVDKTEHFNTCSAETRCNYNFTTQNPCRHPSHSAECGATTVIYSTTSTLSATTRSWPASSVADITTKASTYAKASSLSLSTDQTNVGTSITKNQDSTLRTTADSSRQEWKLDIGLIVGAAAGGFAVLVIGGGIILFIVRKRSADNKRDEGDVRNSVALHDVSGHSSQTGNGLSNTSFQSPPVKLEDLYAKPDKKKKKQPPTTPNPDDPSYQDVLPTGAQHQCATVQDDPNPYTAVRDEPNLYDSIQDDPQYATVQKGRKHTPDVETNPLYGRGSVDNTAYDPEGPLSNDNDRAPSVCEMMDNIIYE